MVERLAQLLVEGLCEITDVSLERRRSNGCVDRALAAGAFVAPPRKMQPASEKNGTGAGSLRQ